MSNNCKLYFAKFVDKHTGDTFHKFGYTHHYDAMLRFKDEMYNKWRISIVCSAYGPEHLVLKQEEQLLQQYPKNFWLHEKIKGVTEIVKLTQQDINWIIKYFKNLSAEWYQLRHQVETTS